MNCKKHSRTSPDVQFEEISLTKQKTRPRTDLNELGKPFPKQSDQKIKKKTQNQCQNAACEQQTTSEKEIWFKQKTRLELTMHGLGKAFRKKSDPKNRRNI